MQQNIVQGIVWKALLKKMTKTESKDAKPEPIGS